MAMGTDLFVGSIVIGIVAIAFLTLTSVGDILPKAYGEDCENRIRGAVGSWMQETALATARPDVKRIFLDPACVEYIEEKGIKFKSNPQVSIFTRNADCGAFDNECESVSMKFDVSRVKNDGEKFIPRAIDYRIGLNPPDTIEVLGAA